jgi:hypothetical protein
VTPDATGLAAAVAGAEDLRPSDAIEAIKDAVIREIQALDPEAEPRKTIFFNHSFAPDLVLTWKATGPDVVREVYLRPDLGYLLRTQELPRIAELLEAKQEPPVVLALATTREPRLLAGLAEASAQVPELLVTESAALDDMVEAADATPSPLRDLWRRNVIRGGRGVILEPQVTALKALEADAQTSRTAQDFVELLRRNFRPDAIARIERSVQLIAMGLTGDLSLLDEPEDGDGTGPVPVRGKMSTAELQALLPYLLNNAVITDDPRYWGHIGDMTDLKTLESMTSYIADLDLTRLVVPNLEKWKATRAGVALFDSDTPDEVAGQAFGVEGDSSRGGPSMQDAPPEDQGHTTGGGSAGLSAPEASGDDAAGRSPVRPPLDPTDRWMIHGRMFSTVTAGLRVHVTATAQKLKAHDGLPARWEQLRPSLEAFDVDGIDLDGVERRVRLTSTSVVADVLALSESINDDYHVAQVRLAAETAEGASLDVRFTDSHVAANGDATMGELSRAARLVLGHRFPAAGSDVAGVLGSRADGDRSSLTDGPSAER